jgi:hypothetical protein
LEEREEADEWAPSVSVQREKRGSWATARQMGRKGMLGQWRGKQDDGESWAARAEREELGWARKGEREREGRVSFFQTLFQTLQTSLKHKTMHSNYHAQALIISNIIEMIFKYLKAKFI